jgi:hypothetical protein
MVEATIVTGNSLIGTCARIKYNPRRHNKGSTDCRINTTDSREESDQDPNRDSRVTQSRGTREATRTKSHGPSHLTDANGIIIGFSHKYHAGTTSSVDTATSELDKVEVEKV